MAVKFRVVSRGVEQFPAIPDLLGDPNPHREPDSLSVQAVTVETGLWDVIGRRELRKIRALHLPRWLRDEKTGPPKTRVQALVRREGGAHRGGVAI
jgi:hypothetical protein